MLHPFFCLLLANPYHSLASFSIKSKEQLSANMEIALISQPSALESDFFFLDVGDKSSSFSFIRTGLCLEAILLTFIVCFLPSLIGDNDRWSILYNYCFMWIWAFENRQKAEAHRSDLYLPLLRARKRLSKF